MLGCNRQQPTTRRLHAVVPMNVVESALAEAALAAAQAVGEEHLSPLGANVGAQEGVDGGNEGDSSNNGAAGVKRGNDEQTTIVGEGDSNNNPAKKLKVGRVEGENENDNRNVVTANIIQASKKDRKEYTASEKLHFLSLLGNNNVEGGPNPPADGDEQPQQPLTAKQLCEKYQVSKSSLHRWKQNRSRLEELVAEEGLGDRKRYTKDLLLKVKTELKTFVEENSAKDPESRLEIIITTQVLMTQAEIIRVGLLELHESRSKEDKSKKEDTANKEGRLEEAETAVVLTEEEYKALKSFKVTKSWAGRVATSLGLLKSPRGERKPRKKVAEEVTAAEGVAISSPEQAKQNTIQYLSESNTASTATTPKPKKQRREFTALEKLDILRELENGANMQQICASEYLLCPLFSTSYLHLLTFDSARVSNFQIVSISVEDPAEIGSAHGNDRWMEERTMQAVCG